MAGGNNTGSAYYNAKPDYKNVHISKGKHVLRVTSLCGPWNFDCLKIECYEPSGINVVPSAVTPSLNVSQMGGILTIDSKETVAIYGIDGRLHATLPAGVNSVTLSNGIYILRTPTQAKKLIIHP